MSSLPEPETVILFLWQASWQAACVLLCAFLLSACLPDARSRARLLHAAIVCCGLAPLGSALLPHYLVLSSPLPAALPFVDAAGPNAMQSAGGLLGRIWIILLGAWLLGFAIQIARILYGWARIRHVLAMSAPLRTHRIVTLLARFGDVAALDLRVLRTLDSPFCWQIHRPVLIIPEKLLDRSDEELELLLRHEISHLRSGDPLHLFLEHCLLAVLWFHPLVRRALRNAQCWREIACDEWALAAGGSPLRLARLLTELAEQAALPRPNAWQLSAQGAASDWQFRLLRLVGKREPAAATILRHGLFSLLAAAVLLLAVVRLAGPVEMAQPGSWTHWPPVTGALLDLVGVRVVDFDLYRAAHDPRERTPDHRSAHRKWRNE